ncbi:MAG: 16S rRNA (cytidine(1402)-2'-O)-methyltransferase [Bacteroidia bacterium]|nr:16S rRNA (cytidine(1402)-2'-O)-methyltransferase [Bacteroidia bacterium]
MEVLWVIPTPIGNLEDLTFRAKRILEEVDVIWCEDTRHSLKLLHHYSIEGKPLRSIHKWNEHIVIRRLFAEAQKHRWKVGLITDSGMPGIADPGYLPIREAHRLGVPVHVLPGASAFLVALIASGLPAHRVAFEGFFPRKGYQQYLSLLREEERTLVWYESPHRLVRTLRAMMEELGENRWACVARELTKVHEEVRRGTLKELYAHYAANPPRGEVVVLVAGLSYKPSV